MTKFCKEPKNFANLPIRDLAHGYKIMQELTNATAGQLEYFTNDVDIEENEKKIKDGIGQFLDNRIVWYML